ncbi:M20/M25/M40 family metallo-hydrolase [Chondromyces crocatus]|uniref:M20/M25/M40 family metallo-hydrolase n=1 Tax=Chondromyces crocatus TaxID=52 RepID=UPI001FE03967|nr:M20/M25/M40 family metallo-hydrolase [Chondromyces crocatus]
MKVVTSPRRRWLRAGLPSLGLVAVLAACSAPPAASPPAVAQAPVAGSAAVPGPVALAIGPDAAGAARVKADVVALTTQEMDGRGTGTEGARLAAEFVARRFAELKLSPLGDAGPEGQAFLQAFEARVGAEVEAPTLSVVRGKQATPVDAKAVTTADGSESATVEGPAVFVGHGISAHALGWDSYAGAEVSGKVVVVLAGAPAIEGAGQKDPLRDFGSARYKLRTAREHKAAGVVLVVEGEELPKAPHDTSGMGVPAVVITRSAAEKLFPTAKLRDKGTWQATKAQPAKPLAGVQLRIATKVTPKLAKAWNVVGLLPAREGSPHAGEFVVVGAHYDHLGHGGSNSRKPGSTEIHHGADDNASGTALMMEVARRMAALPARPDRGVVFIGFGAEELGTLGSRHFVENPPAPVGAIKNVVAMINADMVGRLREDKLLVDGVGTSPGWGPVVKGASEGLKFELAQGAEGFGASDHAPFTAARVPVAFLFTGVHEDYHQPSDTAEKINAEGMERIATLAGRMALAVTQQGERLPFVDAPADPHRKGGRSGFRVSVGTVPDYAYQGKGLRLTGVRPDSPGARAGMQAGDVVVKIGSHEITNIHDYMFSLGELEPGREVVIEVERGGARVPLKVIPAPGSR